MDLKEEILREHSRRQADRLASWVGHDKRRFRELMTLFFRGDYRVAQCSAWVVSICAERDPSLVGPYLRRMIARAREAGVHDAVKRSVMWILQVVDIPNNLLGQIATLCFDFLAGEAPVAVKALSITVLARIAKKEPDLEREIRLVVERQIPYASAAFRARARNVLGVVSDAERME